MPDAPVTTAAPTDRPNLMWGPGGTVVHIIILLSAFTIIIARRPDAALHAQFFAEDGFVWYPDAYQFGLRSLLISQAGYLHTLTRLAALLATIFPFSSAPLIMNLVAITFQALPVSVFLSSRFSQIPFSTRGLASFIYLGLPNTYEINANITTIQWHLALLACLLLLAQPPNNPLWRVLDGIALILISLDGPLGILLVPAAVYLLWKRKKTWRAGTFVLLVPGAVIQGATVLLNWHTRAHLAHINLAGDVILNGGANGANLSRFSAIMGRQVFFSSLLGLGSQSWLLRLHSLHMLEVIATVVGLAFLLYGLRTGPVELKLVILFAATVLAFGLARPLAGPPNRPQWEWLSNPGCGNRYYFLPMLAFLASLWWAAGREVSPRPLRYFAVALLLLLPIGIYRDWQYPQFRNFHFPEYAARFERLPSGVKAAIPINPDWLMELTKR